MYTLIVSLFKGGGYGAAGAMLSIDGFVDEIAAQLAGGNIAEAFGKSDTQFVVVKKS